MGFELAVMAGASLVGGAISANAKKKAAQKKADTLSDAAGQYTPYMEAGQQAVSDWSGYSGVDGMDQFGSDYLASDTYSMFADQANESALKSASATGGLRTGAANVALAEIAPTLMSNAYSQQMSNYQNLANTGLSANSGYGNLMSQSAESQSTADSAMGDFIGSSISSLGGLAMGGGGTTAGAYTGSGIGGTGVYAPSSITGLSQNSYAPTQTYSVPGQTYGR